MFYLIAFFNLADEYLGLFLLLKLFYYDNHVNDAVIFDVSHESHFFQL